MGHKFNSMEENNFAKSQRQLMHGASRACVLKSFSLLYFHSLLLQINFIWHASLAKHLSGKVNRLLSKNATLISQPYFSGFAMRKL